MTEAPNSRPPEIADIRAAAARLAGHAIITPLLESSIVNAQMGVRLLIKAESLQRTGSFKFRGALNALAQLTPAERRGGVVAYSSGNHAQGVAAAAQLLGMPALIVMPADAPAIKTANTRAMGAEIVFYDRATEDREALAKHLAATRGAQLLPPFDDARVIAGQGTIGLELAAQAAQHDARLDAVVIACSGGGLVAGCAVALGDASPETAVWAVEPEGFDDLRRSLGAGARLSNAPGGRSICDALQAAMPGVLPFAIARRRLAGSLVVSDDAVLQAMAVAFADYKLVLEPGGAAALAAILTNKPAWHGKTVAVVASGGNVDPEVFVTALTRRGPGNQPSTT